MTKTDRRIEELTEEIRQLREEVRQLRPIGYPVPYPVYPSYPVYPWFVPYSQPITQPLTTPVYPITTPVWTVQCGGTTHTDGLHSTTLTFTGGGSC